MNPPAVYVCVAFLLQYKNTRRTRSPGSKARPERDVIPRGPAPYARAGASRCTPSFSILLSAKHAQKITASPPILVLSPRKDTCRVTCSRPESSPAQKKLVGSLRVRVQSKQYSSLCKWCFILARKKVCMGAKCCFIHFI